MTGKKLPSGFPSVDTPGFEHLGAEIEEFVQALVALLASAVRRRQAQQAEHGEHTQEDGEGA